MQQKNQPEQSKRQYVAPRLTKLGGFESLTQGPNNGTIDGIFGGNGGFMTS